MPVWIVKMESKNKLKEIDIKNCVCYYFNGLIHGKDINFCHSLLNKKLHENISVYAISYKTSKGPKLLLIRLDKIGGFIMIIDGKSTHLVLSDYGLSDKVFIIN